MILAGITEARMARLISDPETIEEYALSVCGSNHE
jgi:hypothetical protein